MTFFDPLPLILGIPLVGVVLFAIIPMWKLSAGLNVVFSLATFLASLLLFEFRPEPTLWLFIDDFNIYLVVLTTFVGFTASAFSAGYISHEAESGQVNANHLRFYHAMYQAFIFTMLVALTANNLGLMWVAVEGATLATVLMVSLYRTRAAIEAAWKYFILCSVGIALALFGTILIYLAAQPVIGAGNEAMAFTEVVRHAVQFQPDLMGLAFVFLLIGYGTKVGLAPLHGWLPDAHAEGPTPISAVLSGLLLNVALYALLRFKMVLAANGQALAPGPLMIGMGLSSLFVSGLMLYTRRDIKRLFAYSSIEHMGIITFAFGMGGPVANFAALLHMTMHSLAKSAVFFIVGFLTQIGKTKNLDKYQGLTASHPKLGWALVIGVIALAGLPPLGIFMSEFLVVTSTFARQPWLAVVLILGLLIAFGGLIIKLQGAAFGKPTLDPNSQPRFYNLLPIYLHLALVAMAGIWLPDPLVRWFQSVAKLLG
jgi:hydrogenase-4 component F